jgi:hypothetical protein
MTFIRRLALFRWCEDSGQNLYRIIAHISLAASMPGEPIEAGAFEFIQHAVLDGINLA